MMGPGPGTRQVLTIAVLSPLEPSRERSGLIGRKSMLRKLTLLLAGVVLALATPLEGHAKTFYWISHGSPADPVWTYFLAGAKQWAKDTGNTVNTSFHSN